MKSIFLRYGSALILAVLYPLFYVIFSPLTLGSTYLLLQTVYEVSLSGTTITIDSASFIFIPACSAAIAYLLLAELLLVTRDITLQQGLRMFFIGAAAIFFMNIARIVILVFVYLNFGKNYFDLVHIVFWHVVSTIFVAAVWIALVEWYKIKQIPVYSDIKEILR